MDVLYAFRQIILPDAPNHRARQCALHIATEGVSVPGARKIFPPARPICPTGICSEGKRAR